jgi:hypothetical protein
VILLISWNWEFYIEAPLYLFQHAGSSWDELKYIRQAVGFLVCELFL